MHLIWRWKHSLSLVTTSRTTTKVVSCLKISLTSMCVVVRTSSSDSRLRQFFILPHLPTPRLVFQSIEETLLQPVLKSFITVFIQCNAGLENKLIGLAKSIYYLISYSCVAHYSTLGMFWLHFWRCFHGTWWNESCFACALWVKKRKITF